MAKASKADAQTELAKLTQVLHEKGQEIGLSPRQLELLEEKLGICTSSYLRQVTPEPAHNNSHDGASVPQHSAALHQAMSDSIGDLIVAKDRQGRFTFANPAALALLGKPLEQVLGKTDVELWGDKSAAEQIIVNDRQIIESGISREIEERVPLPDGSARILESRKMPYRDEDGEVIGLLSVSRDITQRARALEQLRQSHERLNKVLAIETVGVMFWDLTTGCLVDANDTFLKLMGYSRSDVESRQLTWQKFTPPEYHEVSRAEITKFMMTGRVGPYEKEYFCKDGTRRWLLFAGSSLGDNACVEFCVDIANRKEAEAALRRANSQYQQQMRLFEGITSTTPDFVYVFDRQGRFQYANQRLLDVWGMQLADVIGKTCRELGYEQWHHDMHMREIAQVIQSREPIKGEVPFKAPRTGIFGIYEYIFTPVMGLEGEVDLIAGTTRDVTQRKWSEEELKKLNRTLRAMSNSNHAMTRATDEATLVREVCDIIIRDCGHRMAWVGYARHDEQKTVEPVAWAGTGSDYVQTARINWGHDERGLGPSGTAIRTGYPYVCNHLATDPHFAPWREEAMKRGYASSISLPLLADGAAFGALMIYSDQPAPFSEEEVRLLTELADDLAHGITTLRLRAAHARAAEELLAAKQAAESASTAKDHFIAMLSHELRTPLTPAVAALSLLKDDVRLPSDVREDLEMVSSNLELEVRLIADLLDISRIISGKLHLEKRQVDVAECIREAVKIVSGDLDAKGIKLELQTPGAPYLTLGDSARLQQVFWNLLRNSIKFSPHQSRITLRATALPDAPCPLASPTCCVGLGQCTSSQEPGSTTSPLGNNLIVEVIDQGCGIDPKMIHRLFDPFEQEEKARSLGGLGLGLTICKAVIEQHGGSISGHSDGAGRGATFTVRLPVAQCPLNRQVSASPPIPASGAQATSKPATGGLSVLLVEDHPDTSKLLRRLLMIAGHEVRLAANVADALLAVKQKKPDLLISDLGLPDGTGHNLMMELVAQGFELPAIALSGYGTPADIEKSAQAGFAEHLVKPISSIAILTAAIARATAQRVL